jgi:Clp amino terminal domain, pathogenicity island component/ClpX C4-type zinc finger
LSLRVALMLGHSDIGTEHLLLGLVEEGEGVAAQVLIGLGADLDRVRERVALLLAGHEGTPRRRAKAVPAAPSVSTRARPLKSEARVVACSFCGRRPPETGRLVQGGSSLICERCIQEWAQTMKEPHGPTHDPIAHLHERDQGGPT